MTECDSDDCPLFIAKKLNAEERLLWFNALTEDQLLYLAAYHHFLLKLNMAHESGELHSSIQPTVT